MIVKLIWLAAGALLGAAGVLAALGAGLAEAAREGDKPITGRAPGR